MDNHAAQKKKKTSWKNADLTYEMNTTTSDWLSSYAYRVLLVDFKIQVH